MSRLNIVNYLFNLYAEYIMQNARLDEAQVGIKIARRNINNVRYRDDTTLMAEREEELKNFLVKVKEESEKFGLKLNIQKNKIMFSRSVVSDSLQPHGLQHARLPCPSPTPGAYSRSKLMSIELVMTPNHLILCRPLLLPLSIFPSIRIFSNESVRRIRWP